MLAPVLVFTLALVVGQGGLSEAAPMGTAWTYQGRLMDANSIADGLYDFEFKLYDADVGGSKAANDVNVGDMDVVDGYFTAELDFGSDGFSGDARWLEIGVRPGDSNDANDFVTLIPRREVTPVPYALQTRGLFVDENGNVGIATTDPGSYNLAIQGTGNDYYLSMSEDQAGGADGFWFQIAPGQGGPQTRMGYFGGNFGSTYGFYIYNGRSAPLRFGTNSTERMRITASGNVGIGVEQPDAKLAVNGQVKITDGSQGADKVLTSDASGLASWQTPGGGADNDWTISGDNMYSAVSGNVGIGTASPANKLDVQGGNITVNGFRVLGFVGSAQATAGNTGNNTWQDVPGAALNYNLNASMVVTFRCFGSVKVINSWASFRFVIDGVPYGHLTYGDMHAYCETVGHNTWAWLPWYMERDIAQNAGDHSVKVQFRGENSNSLLSAGEESRTRLKVEAR